MARTIKRGLEYFPLDTDMFQDIRIRKLIKRKGGRAVTIYTLMLCLIYKNGYYIMWDEDLPFVMSEQTGFEEDYIHDAFNDCITLGLFDAEMYNQHRAITSKGIQNRYKLICSQLKRKADINEYSLIPSEEKPVPSESKPTISEETTTPTKSAPPPSPKELSFERFSEWLKKNAPEMLDLKPPTERTWVEVKILYMTPAKLCKACEEIAANNAFRSKWKYFSVALRKWKEQEKRLGLN